MSRGSEIAIGAVSALLCLVMLLIAPTTGPTAPVGVAGFLLIAAIFGILAFALLIKWGRPMSTRVAVGAVSLMGIWAMVGMALNGKLNVIAGMWGLLSVGGGIYAITGRFPESLPLSQIFGQPPRKTEKKKRSRLSRDPL